MTQFRQTLSTTEMAPLSKYCLKFIMEEFQIFVGQNIAFKDKPWVSELVDSQYSVENSLPV